MRSTQDTAPSREEQRHVEELWTASERVYGAARRRVFCAQWIEHHQHLCDVFRSHADHHAREQERYQRILAENAE
jgi:ribosomal protein L17